MKKTFFIGLVMMVLIVIGVNALTINEPRNNQNYYTNLMDFDVSWDSGTNNCKYNLNNQTNKTFGCQDTFIIDIPYHSGRVNVTIYGTDTLDVVTEKTVTFNLIDDNNSIKGLVGLGALGLSIFVSLLMLLLSNWFKSFETEPNEHFGIRVGLMMLSVVMLIPAYNVINLLLRSYIHIDSLTTVMSPFVYTWLFIILIFIIFTYIIYYVFTLFKNKKPKTGDYED